MTLAIVGAQWGDEGKGKITDYLSEFQDIVIRFQGGNNAGHTIVVGKSKRVLHLIPSGILQSRVTAVIAHGVVFDPEVFLKELNYLRDSGIKITPENLIISQACSIITDYHRILDDLRETEEGQTLIGTTKKGIGPCYEDKFSRRGLKLQDLFDKEILRERLKQNLSEKIALFDHYSGFYPELDKEVERLYGLGQEIKPFVKDTFKFFHEKDLAKTSMLFEGSQGILLDIDYGTYPYVTSSNTGISAIHSGTGVPTKYLDQVMGIAKAYVTRVGEGPFPTELFDETGKLLQEKGNEFGATTGRKRRCGWLDLPALRYAIQVAQITNLALTKVDVLTNLSEFKVCVAYQYEGKEHNTLYPSMDLNKVIPIYNNIKSFSDTVSNNDQGDMVENKDMVAFYKFLEKELGVPVSIISYGPERNQTIFKG